ncbi:MAG TPA: NF038122 family metalloprotease [Pyrinomonadaceae bacterium]|jgi:hypothetical protein
MSQFPRFVLRFPGQANYSRVKIFKGFRNVVALGLVAMMLATSFSFSVSAQEVQQSSASVTSKFQEAPRGDSYIVYQREDGTTVCREPTPAERQRQLERRSRTGLQQINHLPTRDLEANATSANATAAGLRIILRGTTQLNNFPQARDAFIRAAARWEALIQNPITVIIDVDYGPTNFGDAWESSLILGSTSGHSIGTASFYRTAIRPRLIQGASSAEETNLYNQLPLNSVPTNLGATAEMYVATPILRALGVINADANTDSAQGIPGEPPHIAFNSNFQFDFDPSNGIDSNKTDFDAVAVHEIGHALGFTSFAGEKELDSTMPNVLALWDLFRFAPGVSFGTFSSAQRYMSSGDTTAGNPVHFAGGAQLKVSTGRSDGTGGDGEQASHWKDDLNATANYIGIMDPTISRGRREVITNNDLVALDYFGYRLNAAPPPPPPPANDNFASAQDISICSSSTTGSTISATRETGEPSPWTYGGEGSIWYRWQAPASGSVTFTTVGSNFDTLLAAFTGTALTNLSSLAANDDVNEQAGDLSSSITFNTSAGTVYWILVNGANGATGNVTLNWTCTQVANQIDDSKFFVAQHYRDFLGREPDTDGLNYWSQQISGNSTNTPAPCAPGDKLCEHIRRISVSAAFFVENEFQRTGGFVYRFYKASYGTRPTFSQFNADRVQVYEGPNLDARQQAFASSWVQRPEFLAKYPATLSGTAFVDALLQNVLLNSGVDLSTQRANLINDFNVGGRARVVRSVTDNATFAQAEYNRAFVLMQYFGYLQRNPDEGGYNFWLGILNDRAPNNFRAMVCAFLTSAEYQQRFGSAVTRSNSDCANVGP